MIESAFIQVCYKIQLQLYKNLYKEYSYLNSVRITNLHSITNIACYVLTV
jgi:hypothetical protein